MSLLTTREAAARLGYTIRRVRQLIAEKRIPRARRVGRDWLIDEPLEVLPPKLSRGRPRSKER